MSVCTEVKELPVVSLLNDSEIYEKREEAVSKAEAFRQSPNAKVICAAKKLIFEEHQSDELNTSKTGKLGIIQESVKYIVEQVMELTPAEYDAIYSTVLNQRATIDHAIRKIVNSAPSSVVTETLFNNKAILFKMCWPEYYEEHFPKPTPMQVFNATGETKGDLIRAGKIKELPEDEEKKLLSNGRFSSAKKERKRVYNHGKEVDKVVYWAMTSILPLFEMTTPQLFLGLAKPRSAGWSRYGFVKIIEARGCYPTPLDFYMWNSPAEWQLEHVDEYMEARKKAKLAPVPALDLMYEAYQRSRKRCEYEMHM